MLFVIEGVDRTGKTSLARRIADKIGAEVVHAGPPTRHPLEEYETALDGYDPRKGNHLILDRWHVGESVWPVIFNRESKYTEAVKRHVHMFMESRGAFVIYARRDSSKLERELVENEEPLHPEDLAKAKSLFHDALKYVGPHGAWDYERHGDHDIDNFIWNAEIRADSVKRIWDEVGPGWVGHDSPSALLVGDELGPCKDYMEPPNDIPFAPYDATSGRYLIDSLPNWRGFSLINSVQGRDQAPRDLHAVWCAFGLPNAVALGDKASTRLKQAGVDHTKVPHPQYWRRFEYNRRNDYIQMIEEAAHV